jgi:predicted nucleic acid-binding protein
MVLIDTDVLIWYMRGNDNACEAVENAKGFFVSVVTYMELVQGMKNKKELNSLRKAFHGWNARVVYLTEDISAKAMFFVEQHFLSHSIQLADALIGASAIALGLPILTGNDKHYKAMGGITINRFLP